ncbi:MAG: flagellar M-ring protein FliF [Betaproteobacteria bacterium]|nr:flagellar M-ring protein FliF [Betaproteobacteria bacterium]
MAATPETTIPLAAPAPGDLVGRLREALARLTNTQKIVFIVALAAVAALIVGGILWSRQPEYRVLFSNIGERDGGAIITALDQMNIPYRFSESGTVILIPGERVHETRLRLASQGLPKTGGVGFEVMENQKFGISQFAEQVNFQRALEGELARTIQSISTVQTARVHLAIPKPSVFVRDQQKPSASVLLSLYPGRVLEPIQIAGIQNLVASSVPELPVSNVSVLDQTGAIISQLKSRLTEAGLDPTQIKYVQEIESSVIKRIEDILAPVVGSNNARVQVAADVDFSQTEQTAEQHRPNTTPPDISIRSQQTSETASVNPPAMGIPGALTNQPPVPPTVPLTQPPVPGATPAQQQPAAGQPPIGKIEAAGVLAPLSNAGSPISTRKDSTTNYEVDRTIRHSRQFIGSIRRLSAAVVVNNRKETGRDGKVAAKPLSEAEIKQINDLVKEAMGFSNERGDTLSVVNTSFTVEEKVEVPIPLWKDPENVELAREAMKYLLIAAVIAYLILGVIRPILRTMFPPPPPPPKEEEPAAEGASEAGEGEAEAGEKAEEHVISPFDQKLARAKEIAQKDSKIVAGIINQWIDVNG